jgi:hypothetical protein
MPIKVLIADHNEIVRKSIVNFLKDESTNNLM